ncbi:hypothetical protein TNCV_2178251 [Trichonephila clavipes]|uniref:Uncharacterized protein n=1 Tax=Trichonephila clavipes TaxID=2585209 RepID=A0A8X7B8W2_TRICX|nr:hypothetical protein TNCV_2178251 [Trichonephila clavipes]
MRCKLVCVCKLEFNNRRAEGAEPLKAELIRFIVDSHSPFLPKASGEQDDEEVTPGGKETDFDQLKQALKESFPTVPNKAESEARFAVPYQARGQAPTDFAYELLKLQKTLQLDMTEQSLIQHIVNRLEPQVLDCVEKKNLKSYQRLYLGSPKSFKDWKMLIYVVKSSSKSFCKTWDRVIIGRDDSDRLVRNLK